MKYQTAVSHVGLVADACTDVTERGWGALDEGRRPYITEAWLFGELLDAPATLDGIRVAFVVDEVAANLPWGSETPELRWFMQAWRLDTRAIRWHQRPRDRAVTNHRIRRPVRFWSVAGTDTQVMAALAQRRVADLPRLEDPPPDVMERELEQAAQESLVALARTVDVFWEPTWRREHKGFDRYPEHELFDVAWGYVDILRGDDRV